MTADTYFYLSATIFVLGLIIVYIVRYVPDDRAILSYALVILGTGLVGIGIFVLHDALYPYAVETCS